MVWFDLCPKKLVPPIMLPAKDSLAELKKKCSTTALGMVLALRSLWVILIVTCAGIMEKK